MQRKFAPSIQKKKKTLYFCVLPVKSTIQKYSTYKQLGVLCHAAPVGLTVIIKVATICEFQPSNSYVAELAACI
jgi:hypothetical protein